CDGLGSRQIFTRRGFVQGKPQVERARTERRDQRRSQGTIGNRQGARSQSGASRRAGQRRRQEQARSQTRARRVALTLNLRWLSARASGGQPANCSESVTTLPLTAGRGKAVGFSPFGERGRMK